MMKVNLFLRAAEQGNPTGEKHRDVINLAINSITKIPNYMGYYKEELLDLREKHSTNELVDYNSKRHLIFSGLMHLKTSEMVKFFIELLDDNQDYENIDAGRESYTVLGNDSMASGYIRILIRDLPLEKDRWGYYREDIPALQAWGREVLEGKRTFRFKDEPGVYNIHGRIREERREPSLPPLPAASGQDGMAGEKDASSPGVRWATLAALFVLLAVAARVFFFSRRSA